MIVVSDTSPITYLHQIDRLPLLHGLFGRVLVPTGVANELYAAAELHSGLDWSLLDVQTPTDRTLVSALSQSLDIGESEAIALALERSADLLLIDEASGRQEARVRGLRLTGLLGVLLQAQRHRLIPSASAALDELLFTTSFRLSTPVKQEFERLATAETWSPPR